MRFRRRCRPVCEEVATVVSPRDRNRLAFELTLAIAFKVVVLALLWFAFFRTDPERRQPSRADLFSPSDSADFQEIRHDDR